MNLKNLNKILKKEPGFRRKQIEKLIYVDLIKDWDEATVLSKNLRSELNKECPLEIKGDFILSEKKSKTKKALIELSDGAKIETVLMEHEDGRNTVCVSSQVGCALGCEFCATGTMGFRRNLEVNEIIEQVLFFERLLKKEGRKVTNVVFMGMGEPLLNYDNVISAIKILNDENKLNIGARKISISTAGITDGIKKLIKEDLQVNLAVSLHAANDEVRSKIMRINKTNSLKKLFRTIEMYVDKTNRQVMFEYLLLNGVNDTPSNAAELAELMKRNYLYMVNLITYNPTGPFQPSNKKTREIFKKILTKNKINFTERYSFGQDINAACGQLVSDKS